MTRLTDAQCADIAAEQENERIARQLDREQRDSDGNYGLGYEPKRWDEEL